MKVRIKPKHMFGKHIREAADEYVREEVDRVKREELYRFLKVFFLMKLLLKAEELMLDNQGNEILWDKVDELLIDRLGLPFDREDYEEREKAVLESAVRRY